MLKLRQMLDESNSSYFGFDVEDLEEDFVVKANLFEGRDEELDERLIGKELVEKLSVAASSRLDCLPAQKSTVSVSTENRPSVSCLVNEKPRARCPLDEQFDLLELNEYGSGNEEEYIGYVDEEECQELLTQKLNTAFKDHTVSVLRLNKEAEDDDETPKLTAEVVRRCKEYAEKFGDEDNQEEVLVEASSDESEVWDCETIVTTYSILDNHPGKIGAQRQGGRRS